MSIVLRSLNKKDEVFSEDSKFYSDISNLLSVFFSNYKKDLEGIGFYRINPPEYRIALAEQWKLGERGITLTIEKLSYGINSRLDFCSMARLGVSGNNSRKNSFFACVYDLIEFLNNKGEEPKVIAINVKDNIVAEIRLF